MKQAARVGASNKRTLTKKGLLPDSDTMTLKQKGWLLVTVPVKKIPPLGKRTVERVRKQLYRERA